MASKVEEISMASGGAESSESLYSNHVESLREDAAAEGPAVGDEEEDEEEDDGLVVITADFSAPSQHQTPSRKRAFEKGANVYVRPDAPRDGDEDAASSGLAASAGEGASATSAEQLRLRFHYSKTAFDTDLEAHPEKPWRKPRTDISDFFNYGFNEATWKLYCEKQLKFRMDQGFGPSLEESAAAGTVAASGTNNS